MIKIISLGVGIQSTALYYMSSMGEIERCDHAIFADTGGEKTDTLLYWENQIIPWMVAHNGITLHRATYKNLKADLLKQSNSTGLRFASIPAFTKDIEGKVGMLRRQCTGEYKIAQVNRKIREVYNLPGKSRFPKMEIWQGITLDEMHRMSIPQEKWKVNVYPFCGYKTYFDGRCERFDGFHMTRNDVINWYNKNGLPIPEKSSCIFCPFQTNQNWLRLKQRQPDDFTEATLVDTAIRDSSKRGIKQPIFLHDSCLPLSEVDLSENQMTLWGNCTDNCDI